MDWGSVIGGIGIGGVISSILTQYLAAKESKKERIFNKKEAAYLGFLESAYCENRRFWKARVDLVGSPKVIRFSEQVIRTIDEVNMGTIDREDAPNHASLFKDIIPAMREDLGIDTGKIN